MSLLHHLWRVPVSPSLPGAIPAAILSGGDPRCRRVTSRPLFGFRTDEEEEEEKEEDDEEEERGWEKCIRVPPVPQMDV